MPPKDVTLQTKDSDFHLFKTDVLAGLVTYSTDKNLAANIETISAERAREIIEMNRRGEKPLSLASDGTKKAVNKPIDLLEDADISRFDRSKRKKKSGNRPKGNRPDSRKGQGQRRNQSKERPAAQNAPKKPKEE